MNKCVWHMNGELADQIYTYWVPYPSIIINLVN